MRRLLANLLLFVSPFVLVLLVEALALPLETFTFRPWEALRNQSTGRLFDGPFYPDQRVAMIEAGAEARGNALSIAHPTVMTTDAYGYRRAGDGARPVDVVVIGDSNIAGASLSDDETFCHVLATRLGRGVYALAPANLHSYHVDPRFKVRPPQVVIWAPVERELGAITYEPERWDRRQARLDNALYSAVRGFAREHAAVRAALRTYDRLGKQVVYHAAVSQLRAGADALARRLFDLGDWYAHPLATDGSMVFLQGAVALTPLPAARAQHVVDCLTRFRDALRAEGVEFLFAPIPNKETIHHDLVPGGAGRSRSLADVLARAAAAGLRTVDLEAVYTAPRDGDAPAFTPDDSHWSAHGVSLAVAAVQLELAPLLR